MTRGPAQRSEPVTARWHRSLVVLSLVPALLVILLSLPRLGEGAQLRFPCPLYPHAVVGVDAAQYPACPLRYGQRIDAVETASGTQLVDGVRSLLRLIGDPPHGPAMVRVTPGSRTPLPIHLRHVDAAEVRARLIASLLLCGTLSVMVLIIATQVRSPASLPFSLVFGSVAVLIGAATAGWAEPTLYPLGALARAILPAAIADLAMLFPRRRESVGAVPSLRAVPYAAAAVLFVSELDAAYHASAATMVLIQRVLVSLTVLAAGLLLTACFLAMREAPSRLARSQARVFLQGLLGVVAVTAFFSAAEEPGGVWSAATVGAALSPLPLGYAMARHHLFDLDLTLRRVAARLVYLLSFSTLVFLPLLAFREPLRIPTAIHSAPVLFATVLALIVPLELVRSWLVRSIETAFRPQGSGWDRLATDPHAAAFSVLRDEAEVARAASRLLAEGFAGADNVIFLREGQRLALAQASGRRACTDVDVGRLAEALLPDAAVDLNRMEIGPEADPLVEAGVEASCAISLHGERLGWILITPHRRGMFLSSGHLAFLSSVATQAASALESIRLTEALVVAEQFAARGRVHAELAHEIGKPLGTLEVLALRLTSSDLPEALRRRTESIARLAGQLREIVRGVLEDGPMPCEGVPVQVQEVVERALREVSEVHGSGRVVVHPVPRLPGLPVGSLRLVRALVNLVGNAIEASPEDRAVELRVGCDAEGMVFEVEDRGRGMSAEELQRARDAFVSFRGEGTGLGLSITSSVVEGLGGRLDLRSEPGVGTRARVHLPLAECDDPYVDTGSATDRTVPQTEEDRRG